MEILKKVKKPTINWYKVMKANINVDVSRAFIKLIQSNPDRSFNFNAYQALRHYYSHDRLEYWRWCVYGRFE